MPIYEITLVFPNRFERRYTDVAPVLGETLSIGSRDWVVASKHSPHEIDAQVGFVCTPAPDAKPLRTRTSSALPGKRHLAKRHAA